MPENRIKTLFDGGGVARAGALLPYFTSGFPDLETAAELIRRADGLGATVIELGVPYSDSIADGPVIQSSFNYTLERGQTVEDTFELVAEVRSSVGCALVAMISYSLVHRYGTGKFMERAAAAGFDGVILPDVPVEESAPTCAEAARAGLCHIALVAPTTSPKRRKAIARASTGFIYQVAVAGITGERSALPPSLSAEVASLREVSGLPVCVGFGISTAQQVREVCNVADGAIVGSAIIRRIADGLESRSSPALIVESVSTLLSELMAGTNPGGT